MRLRAVVLAAGFGLLGIGNEEEPGWLARALAAEDADVEAAIDAYEDGELDTATERLDTAVARRGERAELYYDRGLILLAQGDVESARTAFQHGTESGELQVRASSHYELGNLAMQAEDWQGAIDAYVECLRTQPDHQNAKWNLELALLRKQEQDKQDQDQQDQQDQDGEQGEDGEQDQQDQQQGEDGEQDQQDQQQGEQDQQQGEQDQQQQDQQQGEQDQQQQDQQQGEQDQGQPQEVPAAPVEAGDLDAALDELDRQDAFMFGRPRGSRRKVEKDW